MISRFKRRFSISAPRLAVRPHVPWYVRWAITLPFLLAVGFLVWWAYDAGMALAGFHRGEAEQEISRLREQVMLLEAQNAVQINQLAVQERQAQIQLAAAGEVQQQIMVLQEENGRLREDLSFFQSLPLTAGRDAELSIHNVKLEPGTLPGEYHCRMLLVQGVQRRGRVFQGDLQIVVDGEQGGQKVVLQFPPPDSPEVAAQHLNFKYYQRVERTFRLPEGVQIDSVQIRIFEKGMQEPKMVQTVLLS
ncbi:DUF6776 family protein [Ferrigenium sp. UT5]|uniref:DUF6776 family protein n=1 Tax=Ferrigenium sp. UT5 TaxID=3242105 RepID=UPI00354B3FA9